MSAIKLTLGNKAHVDQHWFGENICKLFTKYSMKEGHINEYISLFPKYYTFLPQYRERDSMLSQMVAELAKTGDSYIIGEIKEDFVFTKNDANGMFEFTIPYAKCADICYGFRFSSRIHNFDISYNNDPAGSGPWEPIYKVDNYNRDTVPMLPNMMPLPVIATAESKFKIRFKPEQSKSIIVTGLWGVFDVAGKKKMQGFQGNIGHNMNIYKRKFNMY